MDPVATATSLYYACAAVANAAAVAKENKKNCLFLGAQVRPSPDMSGLQLYIYKFLCPHAPMLPSCRLVP